MKPAPADDDEAGRRAPHTVFSGGNRVQLLRGGDAMFPALKAAIDAARHDIWLATYIYHDADSVVPVTQALIAAARRGVQVRVVLDGFGCRADLPQLREQLCRHGVRVAVFRPIRRWWSWLRPGQLRRLHQKLAVVDREVAFVGGINLLDDRHDLVHGHSPEPRLDFAVQLHGPVVAPIEQAAQALWTRAQVMHELRSEVGQVASGPEPMAHARRMLHRLRMPHQTASRRSHVKGLPPVRAAFVMRDNLRLRRAIERSYIDAIRGAHERVDLISPYFYPGRAFRRVLRTAAQRGVKVRLLLQGKLDYRIAGLAASALYDELLASGVRIFEYTPAFLHAKIGVVDGEWATVGSSNIDPLSLLLNLEANVVLRDAPFARELGEAFDAAVAASREIVQPPAERDAVKGKLHRGFVAWCARAYLKIAGATGKY